MKPVSRRVLAAVALLASAAAAADPPRHADPAKVFRYAIEVSETNLDPHRISDLYSNILTQAMFDPPLRYDYLARPPKLVPNTLASMPEVSADGLTYTLRVRPGIHFSDDPAFGGKKRELVAADYIYAFKRVLDPRNAAPLLSEIEGLVAGTDAILAKARRANRLDYDEPVEGLQVLDRYTFRVRLTQPLFNFIYQFADCRLTCAVAREVVERYKDDVGGHPVGTGAFRLALWKRSSKILFEANPGFREEFFDGEPAPDDAEGQAILAKHRGRRIPMIGRVEVYVIEEQQPRWLAFLNAEHDLIFRVGEEFANVAMPNNRIAPNLERRGIRMAQIPAMDITYNFFNMDDATVGGYTPEKVALRRAISLAYNTKDEIEIIRKNQSVAASTPYGPGVVGYDPRFRTAMSEYSPAKAKALLDLYGYVDRDGDGLREMPDGSPLVIRSNSTPNARDNQLDELWKRSMDAIGVRYTVRKAKWPDLLKEAYAGKLMFWQLGGSASQPEADTWLTSLYGPNAGLKGNLARFRLPAYDRLYEKARVTFDPVERARLNQEMARLVAAYAPWKVNTHRILTDMWYPWVIGYRRPLIQNQNFWRFIDIDAAGSPATPRRAD